MPANSVAERMSALDGTDPLFKEVPPSRCRSKRATRDPERAAKSAAARPAGPAPTTAKSQRCHLAARVYPPPRGVCARRPCERAGNIRSARVFHRLSQPPETRHASGPDVYAGDSRNSDQISPDRAFSIMITSSP